MMINVIEKENGNLEISHTYIDVENGKLNFLVFKQFNIHFKHFPNDTIHIKFVQDNP